MLRLLVAFALTSGAFGQDFTVAPDGSDRNPGTAQRPFATVHRAREAIAAHPDRGRRPLTVSIRGGTYYLSEPLVLTGSDSGTETAPVIYRACEGEDVVLSGGQPLDLEWSSWQRGILRASTPKGIAFDQLFVNGNRQPMARYPNFDPDARPYNGAAADAFAPSRAAKWSDPRGGFIHAMHRAHWGGYHYRITGKNDAHEVAFEGGWQNNRQMGMHPSHRFVENIFEELDAPGEWFHDAREGQLYYLPASGVDADTARIEVIRLRHLVELRGTRAQPVRHVRLQGFTFRHAARTFMDTREPLLRSDWTIYRGGAVFCTATEDCSLTDCEFDQVGGNAVFVNNYNRRLRIQGCHIHDSGASGVCFVGDPDAVRSPLFEYHQRQAFAEIDRTPGPKTDNYPADCLVEDCLIHDVSAVEKQAAGVQISMSGGITVRHCSIYGVGRAGINISEGTFGGHLIEFCDVFDTVRETGDHGSFNSWGRDRFWHLEGAAAERLPELARLDAERTVLRNNRWRCDHGWDVDLDDGSSNYDIYNNLFLRGGLKLREGFHRRVWNNIALQSSLHVHVWYADSGDELWNNIWLQEYPNAIRMPKGQWGKRNDRNLLPTEQARTKYAARGWDHESAVGDPQFVDPARGDYRVRPGSPALELGFVNFPMDRFGVQKPSLRAIARTPELPVLEAVEDAPAVAKARPRAWWQGAEVRALEAGQFSAFGVSKDAGGLVLFPAVDSLATGAGLRAGDLILRIDGASARTVAVLLAQTNAAEGRPLELVCVRGQKRHTVTMTRYVYVECGGDEDASKVLPPAGEDALSFAKVTARPDTTNEPLAVLHDGRLAQNYGPVFRNGVRDGVYRVDLRRSAPLADVTTWSFAQGGVRGAQSFLLRGIQRTGRSIPIVMVDSREGKRTRFEVTRVRMSDGSSLGVFRRLEWVVQPVTGLWENTAFQEFRVRPMGER